MALSQAKQDVTEARIAALSLPQGGGWLGAARADALARLRAMGLPGKRDEYWKYTDPAEFNAADAGAADVAGAEADEFAAIGALRLVFTDGRFDAAASDALALDGVEIVPQAEAGAQDIHWAHGLYGRLEAAGQVPVARPFAVLNTAAATEGLAIRVPGRPARPVALIYRATEAGGDALIHHVIRIEEGAALTLLESGTPGARANIVTEVAVADGAAFNHIRSQGRCHDRAVATHLFARLGTESAFKSFTLTGGGRLTRNEAVVTLAGDDALAHVAGAALGAAGVHHDDTVFVTHEGERCESRQVFKKVLRDGARGVFQGKILVRPGAQKTDGYQISQSLLLDEDSQFLAKPELEIYADDVQCSHGSTSGAIDETALFYLRSRGVGEDQARALLVMAFLAEAVEEIEDEAVADAIRARLQAWMGIEAE